MLAVSSMSLRAADNVIKIGALLPISGPGSYFGVQDKQGVELALDQLNKAGVNGYKFDVHYEEFSLQSPASDAGCQTLARSISARRGHRRGVFGRDAGRHATYGPSQNSIAQCWLFLNQDHRPGQSVYFSESCPTR